MTDATPPWTAFYRTGRPDLPGNRRGRIHIAAPPGVIRRREGQDVPSTFCNTAAWVTKNAPIVIHDPTQPCPDGLRWCTICLARAAEHLGALDDLAHLVAPLLPQPTT